MKKIILFLFLGFVLVSCGDDTPILPEGRIEPINYPMIDKSDVYTTSEWKTFYKMKKTSFLTPEGVLEERMVMVDSFLSEIPLSKKEAMELSVSLDAKVVKTHYSTKEWFPSWRKKLSYESKIIRRDGSQVIFEEERGQTVMTFKQFLFDKDGPLTFMLHFAALSIILFGMLSFLYLETKQGIKYILLAGLVAWILLSFVFCFQNKAFNLEIVITTFIMVFEGIFFGWMFFSVRKIIKQIKRNRIKRKNKLKQSSTQPS